MKAASLSTPIRASRVRNDPINLPPTLRHRTPHLRSQDIRKTRKCLLLTPEILISALHQFDKFARINVWVSGGVDVIYDFGRDLDACYGRVVAVYR